MNLSKNRNEMKGHLYTPEFTKENYVVNWSFSVSLWLYSRVYERKLCSKLEL